MTKLEILERATAILKRMGQAYYASIGSLNEPHVFSETERIYILNHFLDAIQQFDELIQALKTTGDLLATVSWETEQVLARTEHNLERILQFELRFAALCMKRGSQPNDLSEVKALFGHG